MKLLLIDLDSTILDLSAYKQFFFHTFAKLCSLSDQAIADIYDSVKKQDRWPDLFVNHLHEQYKIPLEKLKQLFGESIQNLRVNEHVLKYLEDFEGKKYIFTFGGREFQLQKIHHFRLQEKVDGSLITLEPKIDFLGHMVKEKSVVINGQTFNTVFLVDDDEALLKNVQEKYPWITVVPVDDIV